MHNYHTNIVFTVEKNRDHFFDTAFAYKNKFKKPRELRRPTKKLNAFLVNYKYSNKPPPLGRQGCCIKYQAAFVSHFSYFGQINWLRTQSQCVSRISVCVFLLLKTLKFAQLSVNQGDKRFRNKDKLS